MSLSSKGSQSVKLTEEENKGPEFNACLQQLSEREENHAVRFLNNEEENAIFPRDSWSAGSIEHREPEHCISYITSNS